MGCFQAIFSHSGHGEMLEVDFTAMASESPPALRENYSIASMSEVVDKRYLMTEQSTSVQIQKPTI